MHITALGAMSFSTVDGPNLGQHPTFAPGSSLLWELSTLKVAQGGRRPTAVLNAIGPTALMGGSVWWEALLMPMGVACGEEDGACWSNSKVRAKV